MIMAQSLFKWLKFRDPECLIDLLAPEWSLPVIARMPEVHKRLVLPFAHGELAFSQRWQLGQWLRPANYNRAIVLPRSMKAALVPYFAGIPRRTGFRGEMRYGVINDRRPFDKSVLDQTVKRFLALGLDRNEPLPEIPPPALRVDTENQQRLYSELGLELDRPVIAMMPGAEYGPAKCWPLESFTALANSLDSAGYHVWVLGSAKEQPLGEAIASGSKALNLCGRTKLVDVVDLLAASAAAVSNDSGLMHVAAAVGTHVVGIYGSTSPHFTPPLTAQKTLHYLDLDCSPCFQRECPLGHLRCLREITPERVLSSIVAN
ncbi:lipopolysaccharide heptosyltransferase II [Woeseia oceani]|uniref:lipopolysaccharide heptosyltransferase II n=2 Tax=Woeseia oceani TaxID=1548547 RepID=A0A193LCY5_9GAMM|nr:lipopolysaccharide heptosyltransferase II [Woeseia oceani]